MYTHLRSLALASLVLDGANKGRVAATSGHPPPSIRLDDGPCKSKLDSPFWSDLKAMFDLEKYMNRFHTAVAAQITSTGGTSHVVVSMWESELENVKPVLVPTTTGKSPLTPIIPLPSYLHHLHPSSICFSH